MTDRSNEKLQIEIADEQTRDFDSGRLISAVAMVLQDHGIEEADISLAIVDDRSIREINKNYLGHDYATDVISFLLEDDPDRHFLSGQLVVSADTAARVGAELGTALDDELLLYVVHGTLHLVGLDDTRAELAQEMRKAEQSCLQRMGVSYRWPTDEA